MARHNYVSLYGFASNLPKIASLGEKQRATLSLKVVKGPRDSYDGDIQLKTALPLIATSNKNIIEILNQVHENDILLVKGNIITTPCSKPSLCPHCQKENKFEGLLTYINPISIIIVKTGLTKEEALKNIVDNCEFSNEVCIIGHLGSSPERVPVLKDILETQYKIGIPRKFHIREDDQNIKSDFPYVKSYGKNAEDDLKYAKIGTTVLIDGYLQGRKFPRKSECVHCGEQYEWKDSALEVVTYQTEYIKNLKTEKNDEDEEGC